MPSEHTILVVDDEKKIADGYARLLGKNYNVRTAYGGEKALEMLDDEVDVILLDRNMPGMKGEEIAEKVSESRFDPQIIMVTSVEPSDEILEMSIDDYVPKTDAMEKLEEAIEETLEVAEYDDTMRDFFALSSKRDVLVEEGVGVEDLPDIEERIEKKAKKGLEKNRSKLETVIQSSPAAIVSLGSDGKVNMWNHAAEQMFGWSADEVEGSEIPIFDLRDNEKLDRVRSKVFSRRQVTDVEVKGKRKSGASIDLNLSAAPLIDPEGEIYGTIFILSDITDRKQREQRLKVLDRVLRHNLRNDLNVIIGRAEFLMSDVSDRNQEHARRIKQTATKLMALGNKAREAEKALEDEKGGMKKINLIKLMEKQVREAKREFPEAEIEFDSERKEMEVYGNSSLEFAVENVIENAVQHNDSDPVVRVSLEKNGENNTAEIRIDDNGPGIPESEVEVVLEGEEDPLSHGSGLGLWTTKWIVERVGGRLEFGDSDLGGARVSIKVLTDG